MPTLIYCGRAPYRVVESPELVLLKYADAAEVGSFVKLTDTRFKSHSPVWLNLDEISSIAEIDEQYDSVDALAEARGVTRVRRDLTLPR